MLSRPVDNSGAAHAISSFGVEDAYAIFPVVIEYHTEYFSFYIPINSNPIESDGVVGGDGGHDE